MSARREYPFVLAVLAGAMAVLTVSAWSDLVAGPGRFLEPALVGAVLVAATGAVLRAAGMPWWTVLPVQLSVLTSWFQHRQHPEGPLGGWLPTPAGLTALADQVRAGARQINTFVAPVEVEQAEAPVYLLAAALVVIVVVDLICCGLGRPAWAGLPVLVALTVPISVLDTGIDWRVLAGTALLYLSTIAYTQAQALLVWSQGSSTGRREDRPPGRFLASGSATAIGLVTTFAALTLPAFVPVGPGLFDSGTGGGGEGGSGTITLTNPLVDLRRDLDRDEQVPLVDARTDARDPAYLRLTVLNQFDGNAWTPSARKLPAANRADGPFPDAPGVSPAAPGQESTWQLSTRENFATSWLPTPYPIRSISIDQGDWRFDPATLDIANTDRTTPRGVDYTVVGFAPEITAGSLEAAGRAPAGIREEMTEVPGLDPRVTRIAEDVTAAGENDYAKAVLLQDWFRVDGGFEYSLDQRAGSGMEQLTRFVTSDKVGYCEQFAAAMAVMARSLGLPARVVVGFLEPTQISPGSYRYTSSDLHAWPEIYFSGDGWVRFEPTPSARTGTPPPWTLEDAPAPAPITPTPSPTPAAPVPSGAPQPEPATGETTGTSSSAPLTISLLVLAGLVLLALPAGVRRSQRVRRQASRPDGRAEMENHWAELRATAQDLQFAWPRGRSARTVAAALVSRTAPGPDDQAHLNALVELLERARYRRDFGLDDADRVLARTAVHRWSDLLRESSSRRTVRRARWFPRSVLPDTRPDPIRTGTADESRAMTRAD